MITYATDLIDLRMAARDLDDGREQLARAYATGDRQTRADALAKLSLAGRTIMAIVERRGL